MNLMEQSKNTAGLLTGKEVPGVKLDKGLERFLGDEEMYIKILRAFTSNTRKVLISLETINKEDIRSYENVIHNIKGSSLTIYASFVGNLARDLENAANRDDWDYITTHHPPFLESVQKLLDDLEILFIAIDAEIKNQSKDNAEADSKMKETRKKIMMVDDDQAILTMGRVILKEKYDVFPIPSAAKLFKTLEKVTPDIILLDIKMPEVDGVDTIKRLKADERYAKIPVIFVTSIDDDRSAFEHMTFGAYSTVAKPFSAPELHTRIENCLNEFLPSEDLIIEDEMPIVLAVDDAPDVLKMVNLLLRDKYKVYTLSDPTEIKDFLIDVKPGLFLLDYRMPELSGLDLVPIIRGYPQHINTPIIFMTGEKTTECFAEAMQLGVCDFILKPIKPEILREKVAKHIKNLR